MLIQRNSNSEAHNWLLHHYLIQGVKRNVIHFHGCLLDIGCGSKPYKEIIEKHVAKYIGLDYKRDTSKYGSPDIVGDALALPFQNDSFDIIVSFQVLEHVPEPGEFLKESYRVLRPDGKMLLSTPFMWGEHEEPEDFYRYTRFGLRYLAEKAGYDVISIEADTGYWSTAILHFNYAMNRVAKGFLKYLLKPIWLDQYLAILLDKIDSSYDRHTSTFTTLLHKPI